MNAVTEPSPWGLTETLLFYFAELTQFLVVLNSCYNPFLEEKRWFWYDCFKTQPFECKMYLIHFGTFWKTVLVGVCFVFSFFSFWCCFYEFSLNKPFEILFRKIGEITMTDDNLEKENEKIIIEKINQSVVSLKELIRGTGNIMV